MKPHWQIMNNPDEGLTQAQIDIALPISMAVIFIGLVISVAMLWKERKRNK